MLRSTEIGREAADCKGGGAVVHHAMHQSNLGTLRLKPADDLKILQIYGRSSQLSQRWQSMQGKQPLVSVQEFPCTPVQLWQLAAKADLRIHTWSADGFAAAVASFCQ